MPWPYCLERQREMDKVKYKSELENNYSIKHKDLKAIEDNIQNEKINFERDLLSKYQKWQETDNENIKEQVSSLIFTKSNFLSFEESKNMNLA